MEHTVGYPIFTGRNEVVAKVMFLHVSVILLTGGVSGQPPGTRQTPPGPGRPPGTSQTPPWDQADTPPWDQADTPPGPGRHTPLGPGRHPPDQAAPSRKKTAAYGQ